MSEEDVVGAVVANNNTDGASMIVWIALIVIAGVSFWCQAVVTEERLVGALNVIAEHFNISHDVAGATLMAAGASSPELFSSFVSLFITHSAMGLGTIVGSEIFNQLVICAGAVYACKFKQQQQQQQSPNTGNLKLDRAIVNREVGFYGLSIALLYVALRDIRPVDDDDEKDHIFISFVSLVAPSKEVFDQVLEQEELTKLHHHLKLPSKDITIVEHPVVLSSTPAEHGGKSLIAFPAGASPIGVFVWTSLLPLRYLMHYTVPDVNNNTGRGAHNRSSVRVAFFATFMCLLWLVAGSYAMVSSLEGLAELLNVPDAVVGVTVSAAGTSLPNYIASRVAAEKGLGNQAVSNAFGSNIFNILVGLGLPWLLYTSFGTGFEPYNELRNDDILESIVILAVVLLIFVLLMLKSGYMLYRWHGVLFVTMYVAYLGLVMGQNWSWDTKIMQGYKNLSRTRHD
eukprot:scaffold5508_cov104-Cylindrotheca_fusiformis.AAC.5